MRKVPTAGVVGDSAKFQRELIRERTNGWATGGSDPERSPQSPPVIEERLRTHGVVLIDGSLVLRPFTEDDWGIVVPWNTDPRVLWFSEGGFVEERSVAEVQGIFRGVSQAADVFVIENDGVAVGDGWVQGMNLPRITRAFPGLRTSRIDLQLAHDVWGLGLGTRAIRLMTGHAFGRRDSLVFGVDISDFNDRSRRAFLRCGYVPWRRVSSPPGAKTRFVHDLICRPEAFQASARCPGNDSALVDGVVAARAGRPLVLSRERANPVTVGPLMDGMAPGRGPRNLDQLTRVYGPTTWDVYDRLDQSLSPPGPDSLHDRAGGYLRPGDVVLDAGCRDGEHLIRLVQANRVTGVGVDPVEVHLERARAAISAASLDERIVLHLGVMQDLPYPRAYFDFVWCRDVVEQVDDLPGGLAELRRVMKPDARLLVYTTFATELLDGRDAAMMRRHLGNLNENLDMAYVEHAFEAAGLAIEQKDVVGTMWREHLEERTRPASKSLLRLSRLRRQRDEIIAAHGRDIYDHIEANLHWEVFMFLGKLEPVIYVLAGR